MNDRQEELRSIVEAQHGGIAAFAQTVPVNERYQGQPVWEGVVHVFDLVGHPKATRAYAWSYPTEGTHREMVAALEVEAR